MSCILTLIQVINDVESFRQGGVAFVYKKALNRDQVNGCWQKDGVDYLKDYETEMYPIRESEKEYITRRLDVERNGPLRRVSLWTSINPELIAINYHVSVSSTRTDCFPTPTNLRQKQGVAEIFVPDKDICNPFLPDVRSQEFPFNTNNESTAITDKVSEIPNDSRIETQIDSVIDITSDDEDDCVIEVESNEKNTNSDNRTENERPSLEKRLLIRPMSQLIESDSTLPTEVITNKEQNSSKSTNGSSKRNLDSLPLPISSTLPKSPRYEETNNRSNFSKKDNVVTQNADNDTTIDVIDIESDEESYSVKTSYVSSAAVQNTDSTPFKRNQIVSSQMTPTMESLTMSNSIKSPNLSAQSNAPTAGTTTIHPSFSSNTLTKRKFITTPKRSHYDQPLRQNQYQLAAATKVLNFESTQASCSLNTEVDLKPDEIDDIEEICIDGSVSKRDPISPFIPDNHSIVNENPLEKSNPFLSNSPLPSRNKADSTEVENVIDVSSDEECNT